MLADLRQSSPVVKAGDALAGTVAAVLSIILPNLHVLKGLSVAAVVSRYATVSNVLWVVLFAWTWNRSLSLLGLYRRRTLGGMWLLGQCLKAACLMSAMLGMCLAFHPSYSRTGRSLAIFVALTVVIELGRAAHISRMVAPGLFRTESVFILGTGRRAQRAWRELRVANDDTVSFLGFVDDCNLDTVAPDIRERFLCSAAELPGYLLRNRADTVIVATSLRSSFALTRRSVAVAEAFGLRVLCLDDTLELGHRRTMGDQTPVFHELVGHREFPDLAMKCKYALDKAFAVGALVATSPLLLVLCVIVKLTMEGPVLTTRLRYGYRRASFGMLSLNTSPAQGDGPDARPGFAAELGAFLRRTYLDRLPRLWNILVGDMSWIGPEAMETVGPSPVEEPAWAGMFTARPGLCRPSKLMGKGARGLQQMIAADVMYLRNWSLKADAELIAQVLLTRVLRIERVSGRVGGLDARV
jgi:lipopolysaccharide/colanic/teichoic acid biosynthesis glycosyltransferase